MESGIFIFEEIFCGFRLFLDDNYLVSILMKYLWYFYMFYIWIYRCYGYIFICIFLFLKF